VECANAAYANNVQLQLNRNCLPRRACASIFACAKPSPAGSFRFSLSSLAQCISSFLKFIFASSRRCCRLPRYSFSSAAVLKSPAASDFYSPSPDAPPHGDSSFCSSPFSPQIFIWPQRICRSPASSVKVGCSGFACPFNFQSSTGRGFTPASEPVRVAHNLVNCHHPSPWTPPLTAHNRNRRRKPSSPSQLFISSGAPHISPSASASAKSLHFSSPQSDSSLPDSSSFSGHSPAEKRHPPRANGNQFR
jgi:hypothetical protein